MYEGLAGVYDLLMADVDADGWFAFYSFLLKSAGVAGGKICDAACGTGAMTLRMADAYDQVTGVDLSPDMLRAAQEKARAMGKRVHFVHQDIAELTLPSQVDAIVCANDGVNYLETPARVRSFFTRAAESLCPGGALAFDVSSPHKLRNILGDSLCCEERDELVYLWQNHWDEDLRTVRMELTFFTREADGRYRRFEETHVQRAHKRAELQGWLEEAGFSAEFFGDRAPRPPIASDARWFILARKMS